MPVQEFKNLPMVSVARKQSSTTLLKTCAKTKYQPDNLNQLEKSKT
jgi:hypothetical protein